MSLEFIIFDLDNTLYGRGSGLMEEIGRRIQAWLCNQLDLTWEDAKVLRRKYLREYGTTMGGLMAEHAIDVSDYLAFVHDIDVGEYLEPDPALVAMLDTIPLRKVVYTNATSSHARGVLRALGAAERFERIIGVEEVGLDNKVNRTAYECVLSLLSADGAECVMVEDSPRNLPAAKAMGMTTILVWSEQERVWVEPHEDFIDFEVDHVLEVGRVVERLLSDAPGSKLEMGPGGPG